jgi:hypothetical protein
VDLAVDLSGLDPSSIWAYISGRSGIVESSSGYLARAFLGFSPKLGCALAPYMLLKKRLDLEAPAATTLGEPAGVLRRRVRKTHSVNLTADSFGLLGLRRLFVSIARQPRPLRIR